MAGNGRTVTLAELAKEVGGRVEGDERLVITGASGIREARAGEITFLANGRYAGQLQETKAAAVVVEDGAKVPKALSRIVVRNPDWAFARILDHFSPAPVAPSPGIHPTAAIAPGAKIGKQVTLGAHAVVETGASIGDGSVLYAGVYVGHEAKVGRACLLYPGVVVRERVEIGDRVILHAGAVIGCDGFGYTLVDGAHVKIPQVGTVVIEDDVEIGANTTVDRARFDVTRIGKGTKIDNLVQVGHNVQIGRHCVLAALVGIAGSARIGDYVLIGGQVGIGGHLTIGDRVQIGGGSGVTKDIPAGRVVSGFPARPHDVRLRDGAYVRKLPRIDEAVKALQDEVKTLRETVRNLENRPAND